MENRKLTAPGSIEEIAIKSKSIKAGLKSRYFVYKLQKDFIYKKFDSNDK